MPPKRSIEDILTQFVVTPTGCHEWTASRTPGGYGQIARRGEGGTRLLLAHRAQWQRLVGPIPNGLIVMHKCDNPPCINIEHLRLGTHQDNMDDMWNKGRHPGTRRAYGSKRVFLKEYRRTEEAKCAQCAASFMAVISERKRGRGLFCSRSCVGFSLAKRRSAA